MATEKVAGGDLRDEGASLLSLPDLAIFRIVRFLPARDRVALSRVCRRLRAVARDRQSGPLKMPLFRTHVAQIDIENHLKGLRFNPWLPAVTHVNIDVDRIGHRLVKTETDIESEIIWEEDWIEQPRQDPEECVWLLSPHNLLDMFPNVHEISFVCSNEDRIYDVTDYFCLWMEQVIDTVKDRLRHLNMRYANEAILSDIAIYAIENCGNLESVTHGNLVSKYEEYDGMPSFETVASPSLKEIEVFESIETPDELEKMLMLVPDLRKLGIYNTLPNSYQVIGANCRNLVELRVMLPSREYDDYKVDVSGLQSCENLEILDIRSDSEEECSHRITGLSLLPKKKLRKVLIGFGVRTPDFGFLSSPNTGIFPALTNVHIEYKTYADFTNWNFKPRKVALLEEIRNIPNVVRLHIDGEEGVLAVDTLDVFKNCLALRYLSLVDVNVSGNTPGCLPNSVREIAMTMEVSLLFNPPYFVPDGMWVPGLEKMTVESCSAGMNKLCTGNVAVPRELILRHFEELELDCLKDAERLKVLRIDDTHGVEGFAALQGCANLREIYLHNVICFERIAPLAKMDGLRRLDVIDCDINESDDLSCFKGNPLLDFNYKNADEWEEGESWDEERESGEYGVWESGTEEEEDGE